MSISSFIGIACKIRIGRNETYDLILQLPPSVCADFTKDPANANPYTNKVWK